VTLNTWLNFGKDLTRFLPETTYSAYCRNAT